MAEATSARWDLHRSQRERAFMRLQLVSGGHPDRWLPLISSWRIEETDATTPDNQPIPGIVPRRAMRAVDHRWSEHLIAEVLARTEPAGWHSRPADDVARGMILNPDDHPGAVHLHADWVFTVTDSPPAVVAQHFASAERREVVSLADAWGWLGRAARAVGDEPGAERAAAEETLASLSGR